MEKKEYVKLWISYESYFELYSPEQIGRLVLAMMDYRKNGTKPEFTGDEKFVWPALKRDIDESLKAQEAAALAHRESGKKGGRPKNQNDLEKISENQNNQNGFDETKKRYRSKDKVKDKVKDKDIDNGQGYTIPPKSPQGEETPEDALAERKIPEPIKAELRKWFQYKKERREIYKPTGLLSFLSTVEKKCVMYGEEDIINLIEESMSNGWRGIIWERLSGKEKPSEKPIELPPDLIEAKKQHEEAMERFRAGEANWEDLIL